MFESLDFVYVPTEDVDASAQRYVEDLGAQLIWRIRRLDTVVACLRVSESGSNILLSGHLEGEAPILIYRVADCKPAVSAYGRCTRPAGDRDSTWAVRNRFRAPGGACTSSSGRKSSRASRAVSTSAG